MACGDPRLVDPEHVATGIHDPKVAKTEIWDHLTKWSWNVMKRPRVFWERPIQSPPKNYEKKKQTHKSLKNHLKQEHIPNLIHQNVHVFFLGGGKHETPKTKETKTNLPSMFRYDWDATSEVPLLHHWIHHLQKSPTWRSQVGREDPTNATPPQEIVGPEKGDYWPLVFFRFLGSHDVDVCWFIWNIELIWFTWFSLVWPQRRMS